MTIGTTVGRELNVNTIVLRADQLAGLMAPEQGFSGPTWNPRAAFGRDLLETILDELQTEGVFARGVSFTNLTLVAGTAIYALPETVFDVIEDGSYIAAGEDVDAATAEMPVIQKDRETWQRIGTKSVESQPTLFFTDRSVFPIQVRLWPTPSEAGTIRFQTHRLLADTTDGNTTVDLERYWVQYLMWELAHQLASSASHPESKCARLAQTAAMKKERAKAYSNQGVPSQIYLDHPTSWSSR